MRRRDDMRLLIHIYIYIYIYTLWGYIQNGSVVSLFFVVVVVHVILRLTVSSSLGLLCVWIWMLPLELQRYWGCCFPLYLLGLLMHSALSMLVQMNRFRTQPARIAYLVWFILFNICWVWLFLKGVTLYTNQCSLSHQITCIKWFDLDLQHVFCAELFAIIQASHLYSALSLTNMLSGHFSEFLFLLKKKLKLKRQRRLYGTGRSFAQKYFLQSGLHACTNQLSNPLLRFVPQWMRNCFVPQGTIPEVHTELSPVQIASITETWVPVSGNSTHHCKQKLAQLPAVGMQKLPGIFCCYSKLSPKVIQPSFDAQSLCILHNDCAETSTHANRWSLDDSLVGACCMSTAGS
ncbi:hypothetical protein VP01_242g1 [Puccinia sorghi]|uniref:Uncharacterized protein n=1 Tax=Puccinia sorghi TaxID=27349 RepID=A0A0L6V6E6_9BASI|nr:hypothetical protein VP01_242g1 [Puccinia sorghi]